MYICVICCYQNNLYMESDDVVNAVAGTVLALVEPSRPCFMHRWRTVWKSAKAEATPMKVNLSKSSKWKWMSAFKICFMTALLRDQWVSCLHYCGFSSLRQHDVHSVYSIWQHACCCCQTADVSYSNLLFGFFLFICKSWTVAVCLSEM